MSKFCVKCGSVMEDDEMFCSSCGANQQGFATNGVYGNMNGDYVGAYKKKSAGIALLLSFFVPGLGHMYIGKVVIGLVYMAIIFLLGFSTYSVIWMSDPVSVLGTISLISLFLFILWIYAMYDVYKGANRYNEVLVRTGQPPW